MQLGVEAKVQGWYFNSKQAQQLDSRVENGKFHKIGDTAMSFLFLQAKQNQSLLKLTKME